MPKNNPIADMSLVRSFWAVGAAITVFKILILVISEGELGPDESQYWFWSKDLAFGYFSKPPLIAWFIAATTGIFGNAEWAVRLSSPLFHFGAASFLYLAAQKLYDARVAFWTGLAWLTIPGGIISSYLITTDASLLFFWSAALLLTLRIASEEKVPTQEFALLGAMIGLGLMSKYAMIYFPIALFAAAVLDTAFRKKILRPPLAMTAFIIFLLILPNIVWNAQNEFQTVAHTADNANWNAPFSRPGKFLAFFGAQLAIVGVIPFAVILYLAARWKKLNGGTATTPNRPRLLLIFALTPLLIVSFEALISRAHANWAATAYPSAVLLTTGWLFGAQKAWLAKASVAFHAFLLLVFSIVMSNFVWIDKAGFSYAIRDIRGWSEQTSNIAHMANGFDAIVIDDRALMGEMLYYEGEDRIEVVTIDSNANTDNHYEWFKAFEPERHKRVLFVTTRDDDAHVSYRFSKIKPLGAQTVSLGGDVTRTYHLFDISEYYVPGSR